MMDLEHDPKQTWALYQRLARQAVRYRGHLIIAVLGGLLCGGSVFFLLQISRRVLAVGDMGMMLPVAPAAAVVATNAPALAAAPAATTNEAAAPIPSWLRDAQKQADRLHIPLTHADGRMTWQFLALALVLAPVVVGVRLAALYLNQYCIRWLGARVIRDLRDNLFENLQSQSLKYHGKVDVGQLISHCTADIGTVDGVIYTSVVDLSRAPFEIGGALLFVILFSQEHHIFGLLALVAVGVPLCIVPLAVLGRRVREWTHRSLDRISLLVSRMHENLTCIRVVKAFHMESAETDAFREENRQYFKAVMRSVRVELLMSPLMEGAAILLGCVFLVVCFGRGMHFSEIALVGGAVVLVYRPIKQMSRIIPMLERGAAALARVYHRVDMDMRLPEAVPAVSKTSFADRIRFADVSFRYQPQGEPVICHASFDVPRGSMVAVVGATGSGKTTLANLLCRFYDPTDGCVSIDGVDLRQVRIADVRRLVGVLTQETILFNGTIAYNIAYGTKDATRAQIQAAAEQANAHRFILAHPAGYDRLVGEKGFVLSGGERQRIAIARILLRNPPILILDEATSALDTVTERQVQEEIARAMANRTIFAIAHRLSTIRRADQILVLDKGSIIERGTHDELYAANGAYRRLCDMQFTEPDGGRA